MSDVKLDILFQPVFDRDMLNRQIEIMKKSLGPLGKSIKPIDEAAWTEATKTVTSSVTSANDEIAALQKRIADLEAQLEGGAKRNPLGKMFAFNQIQQGFSVLMQGVNGLAAPFVELDTATANLRTLGDEAAAMAPNLREAAIAMSKDLPFAAAEIQTTMFDALASGVKGGEEGLKSFADTAAKLATGGGAGIGDATKLLAGQLNAYGKSAEDAAKFSDVFFNTVNFGVTSIPELANTLSNVIPTAASLGVEIEGVGAALAVMTSKGVPTAQSTTKLNQLLLELAKPGAALKPILDAAGVSLESLNKEDLPVTLAKVSKALKDTGTASVAAFSSSEAAAAFNVLSGDIEGFAQTFLDVRDTSGSAQYAYEQMSDSIEVQTKQMMSAVNAFVIEGLDVMGAGFVGVMQGAGQLAPLVSTLAGLGAIIPEGFGAKLQGVGKAILEKVVPGLLTQTVATGGATVAQWSLNAAIAANPIGAALVAIAALGGALVGLQSLLNETAAEKLEDQKAETEVLQQQRESTKSRYDAIAAQQAQVEAYGNSAKAIRENEAAAKNEKLSEEERAAAAERATAAKQNLIDKTVDLTATYPGAVSASKSFEDNLKGMQEEAAKSADELIRVAVELNNMDKQIAASKAIELNLETQVAAEDLETQLADALDMGFAEGLKAAFTKGDILAGLDSALLGGFGNEISEALFGASSSGNAAENMIESFKNDVFNAKTGEEIAAAQSKMIAEIRLKGEELGLSPAEQSAAIKNIKNFGDKRKAELEQVKANEANLAQGSKDLMAQAFFDATRAGKDAGAAAKAIAEGFAVSAEKVQEVALAAELDKARESGELTDAKVAEIAKKYGKTAEEARKILGVQDEQKKKAAETATEVKKIGEAFGEAKKAAQDAVNQQVAALAEIAGRRRQARTQEERDQAEADRKKALAEGKAAATTLKQLTKDEEDARAALGLTQGKKLKTIKDVEDQITRLKREAASIQAELVRNNNEDEIQRNREALNARLDAEQQAVRDEIEATKKNKDLTAEARTKLEEALTAKLQAFQAKATSERYEFERTTEAKALKERYDASVEANKKLSDDLLALTQIRIENMEAFEVRAGDEALDNAETLNAARLELMRQQMRAELDTLVDGSAAVVEAREALNKAFTNGDAEAIAEAQANLVVARARALAEDPVIIEKQRAQQRQINDLIEKGEKERREIEINSIEDLAAQKRERSIQAAKDALDSALEAAKGNNAAELAARVEFLAAKKAAELDYIKETNLAYEVMVGLTQDLTENFKTLFAASNAEQLAKDEEAHKKRLDQWREEQEALAARLKAGAVLYEDYQEQISNIDRERSDAEVERAEKAAEDEVNRRQQIADALSRASEAQYAKFAELSEKGEDSYERLATAAGLSFAAQIAAGAQWADATLAMLLDTVSKGIAMYIPEILAASISLLGPIAGPIAAGVAIASVQAALAFAKSGLGAEDGVVDITNAYNRPRGATDTIPLWVAPGETILSKEDTDRNREALNWIRSTHRSIDEYAEQKASSRLTGDLAAKMDILTEKVIEVSTSIKSARSKVDVRTRFAPLKLRNRDLVAAVNQQHRITRGAQ